MEMFVSLLALSVYNMHTEYISMPFLQRTVNLLIESCIAFQEKLYESLR